MTPPEGQRIDKWLWHARFARTRSAAQDLAISGAVRINREKVRSASRLVRPGDVLTLAIGRAVRVVRIDGLAERRGSFDVALDRGDHGRDHRRGALMKRFQPKEA